MIKNNNLQNNLNVDHGQGVVNNYSDHGQSEVDYGQGGGQTLVSPGVDHGQPVSDHGQGVVRGEFDYGQKGYLTMVKAVDYGQLSEKTLRRRIREVLISAGLDWKSAQQEIEKRTRKIKKVNSRRNIIGLTSFDWELSVLWLDELKEKIVLKPKEEKINQDQTAARGEIVREESKEKADYMSAQFMSNPASPSPTAPEKEGMDFMEIDGRKYTKEHLQDILENYKDEKETKKTMMELQKQINVVMAQMGQIQKMMLLRSPKDNNEDNI